MIFVSEVRNKVVGGYNYGAFASSGGYHTAVWKPVNCLENSGYEGLWCPDVEAPVISHFWANIETIYSMGGPGGSFSGKKVGEEFWAGGSQGGAVIIKGPVHLDVRV